MNPDVDRYIGQAAPFARPELLHLLKLLLQPLRAEHKTMNWKYMK